MIQLTSRNDFLESAHDPLSNRTDESFDCAVIGAGVAGSLAALKLSKLGYRILIIEAKQFPREKVCGCCLNQRGIQVLTRAGLRENFEKLNGSRIDQWLLSFNGKSFRWSIPGMVATKRSQLDSMLVECAVASGAKFMQQTRGFVLPMDQQNSNHRLIEIRSHDSVPRIVGAKLVLVADGLTLSSLSKLDEFHSTVSTNARIGVQALLPRAAIDREYQDLLSMLVSKDGYVGIAPVGSDTIDVAAAIEPQRINSESRPQDVVASILRSNRYSINFDELRKAKWQATPPLTRHSKTCGSQRLLLIGDSLGYVEPFTGEGMSWALRSAELVIDLAVEAMDNWNDRLIAEWRSTIQANLTQQQWLCAGLASLLRHPTRAKWLAVAANRLPHVRHWAMQKVSVQ